MECTNNPLDGAWAQRRSRSPLGWIGWAVGVLLSAGLVVGCYNVPPQSNHTPGANPADGSARGDGNGNFVSMAPPSGNPLPPATAGQWQYIDSFPGALCRDGSPAGFYYKYSSTSTNLMIFLEGGGACFNGILCGYNPKNVNESMPGESLGGTVLNLGVKQVRQTPRTHGIFDESNPDNPVRGWNMVYVPYCSGDAYVGTHTNVLVPGMIPQTPQQFLGHSNMMKFLSRIIPTFQNANKVLITGVSAGGIGSVVTYPEVADGFGPSKVYVLDDSGPAFADQFMAPCMQQQWRDLWGLDGTVPPDCGQDCFKGDNNDGGGIIHILDYATQKYPNIHGGIISSQTDEIMRFFYGFGVNDCGGDVVNGYPPEVYTDALHDLRDHWLPPNVGTYYLGGGLHQHIFRDRFYSYDMDGSGKTMVQFLKDILNNQTGGVIRWEGGVQPPADTATTR